MYQGENLHRISRLLLALWAILLVPWKSMGDTAEPSIVVQPESLAVAENASATFSVVATGDDLSYQWWHNGAAILEGTNSSYAVGTVEPGDTGDYQVVVFDSHGSVASTVVRLTLVGMDQAPAIVIQPESQIVAENGNATFSVTATGDNLRYQWCFNGTVIIPEGTNAIYSVMTVGPGHSGYYGAFVSNEAGFAGSAIATLTVGRDTQAPVITVQPLSQTVAENTSAAFSVTATGENLTYQWWHNGAAFLDDTNSSWAVGYVSPDDSGDYQVVVANEAGSTVSRLGTLTVVPPGSTPPTLSSISRQYVEMNSSTRVLSFEVDGENSGTGLTVSGRSWDTNLIPNENLLFVGAGTNRTVTIRPAPNRSGICDITITAIDSTGAAASSTFAITVNDGNQPPSFVGNPPVIAQPYQPYSYTVNVFDSNPDDRLQIKALNLPSWLSFDAVTRVLSGTPPPGGPDGDEVILQLSDNVSLPIVKEFRIWTADWIGLTNASDVEKKRQALIQYVWGETGWPTNRTPSSINTNISDWLYAGLYNEEGNLASIDLYTCRMDYGLKSRVYHFHPIRDNGRLFIYHEGHWPGGFKAADLYINSAGNPPGLVIPTLLREGFSVLAFSMPVYDGYGSPTVRVPGAGIGSLDGHDAMFHYLDRPFRFFFEPIVTVLNYVEDVYGHKSAYMTGLSGGGWTTTVYAALDRRIQRSYPVGGSVPNYLRVGFEGLGDAEQVDPGFYRIANYEELYVLGALGLNRLELQVLNQYDSCCFYGTRHTNWIDRVQSKVQELGPGGYDFRLDDTHSDHKISAVALGAILDSLPPTLNEIASLTVSHDAGQQTIPLSGITPALPTRTNDLVVAAEADNHNVIGWLWVDYNSPDSVGTLHFEPIPNSFGFATISVSVSDGRSIHSRFTQEFKVTVRPTPPTVSIITPTNGAIIELMRTVRLEATINATGAAVSGVEFREGTNLLAMVSSQPYVIDWMAPAPGSYQLTAVAVDDWGPSPASEPATVTVLEEFANINPCEIERIRRLAGGGFEILVSGPEGYAAVLEATSIWATWTPLTTNRFFNGSTTFFDPESATTEARFYRVQIPPPCAFTP